MSPKIRDVAFIVLTVTWVAFVIYHIVRDRQMKPVDIIVSTVPPREAEID